MAKTLFDLTYQLARLLNTLTEGVATNGSQTTIIDTVERTEADDFWNGGTAWITYDAGGAGAAPQGEYSFVSDFVQSTGTVTLRSTLTAAVAANDRYAIAPLRYPLHLLIQKINEAISVIEKTDLSTVVIAAEQTEYSLPTDLLELKEVWLGANGDDSDDNRWYQVYDWEVQKSDTGTADKLVFMRQHATDTAVKLVYLMDHAALRVATDKLDQSINIKKVIYNAAVGCLLWRKAKVGDSDLSVNDLLNIYQPMAERANTEHPIDLPRKQAKTIHPIFNRP
jgi:hypothetical protein